MKPLVLFFNECSCEFDDSHGEVSDENLRAYVLTLVKILKKAQEIRGKAQKNSDISFNTHLPFAEISFKKSSLSSILGGNSFKDEWRVIKGLNNRSPLDIAYEIDQSLEKVYLNDACTIGMTLAEKYETAVISFNTAAWLNHQILAEFRCQQNNGAYISQPIEIRNISTSEHVESHRNFLEEFGYQKTSTSKIYETEDFAIHMYFKEQGHELSHCHILPTNRSSSWEASVSIKTRDVLKVKNRLPSGIQAEIKQLIETHQAVFLENWNRCRNGQPPLQLPDEQ